MVEPSDVLEPRLSRRIEVVGECWVWNGARNQDGYAYASIGGSTCRLARALYIDLIGPVADWIKLDHECRNRACVNPRHLSPVSNRENILRGLQGELKTHCAQGHAWVRENIAQTKSGGRRCAVCKRERERARRAARAAAPAPESADAARGGS